MSGSGECVRDTSPLFLCYTFFMKLQRFFVQEKLGDLEIGNDFFVADKDLENQLRKVFRFHGGEVVELFDGSGFNFESEILNFSPENGKDGVNFKLISKKKNENVPKVELHLFQAIIKKDNFEWIVEKCTELGVKAFHPIISERSEKKDLNLERLNKIAKEASEQSGRAEIPDIFEPAEFSEALNNFDGKLFAFDLGGVSFSSVFASETKQSRKSELDCFGNTLAKTEEMDPGLRRDDRKKDGNDRGDNRKEKIGIIVGPEGGWSEGDMKILKDKKVETISLGKQVLRAETAAIVASSLFLI